MIRNNAHFNEVKRQVEDKLKAIGALLKEPSAGDSQAKQVFGVIAEITTLTHALTVYGVEESRIGNGRQYHDAASHYSEMAYRANRAAIDLYAQIKEPVLHFPSTHLLDLAAASGMTH